MCTSGTTKYFKIDLHVWNETHEMRHVQTIYESSVNPKSTSNQSSKPCTVLQYPSKKEMRPMKWDTYKRSMKMTDWLTTGWRRLIGSPKLQIIFHKRATKYRALLLKMTYKDKGSYESSPLIKLSITLIKPQRALRIYTNQRRAHLRYDKICEKRPM